MFHYSLISVLLIAQGGKIASNGPDLRCGANCLYIALKALELTTENFSALEDRLGQPRFQGYTLAQLHEAASDFGAHSYPVLTSPERLRQRRSLGESFACIAHLKRDHFVLVTDMNDQTIHIVDPPIVYDVPLGTFHSMFSGHALLIGREALRSEDAIAATVGGSDWIWVCLGVIAASSAAVLIVWGLPKARIGRSALGIVLAVAAAGCGGEAKNRSELGRPRVVVENEHIDLGELDLRGSTPGVANFILRNEGSAPLQLRNVSSSCGCAVASIETPLINQGAESKLVVSVPPKGEPGERRSAYIVVQSNDPDRPRVNLRVSWKCTDVIILSQNSWNVGKIPLGGRRQKKIQVLSGGSQLESIHCTAVASGTFVDCEVEPSLPDYPHLTALKLAVSVPANAPIGELSSIVQLEAEGSLENGKSFERKVKIPVTWTVTSRIRASPVTVFFPEGSVGYESVKTVVVASDDEKAFKLTQIDNDNPVVRVAYNLNTEATCHVLKILAKPRTEGPFHSEIRVHTDQSDVQSLTFKVGGYAREATQ